MDEVVPFEVAKMNIGASINLEEFCKQNYQRVTTNYQKTVDEGINPYIGKINENLIKQSPSKLIDGFWLRRIKNQSFTSLQKTYPHIPTEVLKEAKSTLEVVFDEEDGEGVMDMNHVHIFENLLKQAHIDLPHNTTKEYVQDARIPDESFFSPCIQMGISVLQKELFLEMCGFTLNFEEIPTSVLQMRDALKKERLDDYYYLLHITIDNPASGHCYMARKALETLLAPYQVSSGEFSTDNDMWRKLFNGYVLATFMSPRAVLERLSSGAPGSSIIAKSVSLSAPSTIKHQEETRKISKDSTIREQMEGVMEKYAPYAACPLHRSVRIKGQPMDLAMSGISSAEFLDTLATSGWVKPGYPEESALVKSLSFGKKMFKVFDDNDQEVIKKWISSLPPRKQQRPTQDSNTNTTQSSLLAPLARTRNYIYLLLSTLCVLVFMSLSV
ncbi:Hsp32 [Acrasis kona]|uniref:Hsp32 n=1 Tax=Acrasis kona TaxID=1008807 RepID=A0AAW2YK97_9EUKA